MNRNEIAIATQDKGSLYYDARYEERINKNTQQPQIYVVAKEIAPDVYRYYSSSAYDLNEETPWTATHYRNISTARSRRTFLRQRCEGGQIQDLTSNDRNKINIFSIEVKDYDMIETT